MCYRFDVVDIKFIPFVSDDAWQHDILNALSAHVMMEAEAHTARFNFGGRPRKQADALSSESLQRQEQIRYKYLYKNK
jgi:hypothetical protein